MDTILETYELETIEQLRAVADELRVRIVEQLVFQAMTVPGPSYWPQNQPFDANLALPFTCRACLIRSSTTHKTPPSASLSAFQRWQGKNASSSSTWPRNQSQWTQKASISGSFGRNRVHCQETTSSVLEDLLLLDDDAAHRSKGDNHGPTTCSCSC